MPPATPALGFLLEPATLASAAAARHHAEGWPGHSTVALMLGALTVFNALGLTLRRQREH